MKVFTSEFLPNTATKHRLYLMHQERGKELEDIIKAKEHYSVMVKNGSRRQHLKKKI